MIPPHVSCPEAARLAAWARVGEEQGWARKGPERPLGARRALGVPQGPRRPSNVSDSILKESAANFSLVAAIVALDIRARLASIVITVITKTEQTPLRGS